MAIPIGAYSSNASLAAKERAEDVMSGKAHYEANGSCKIRPTSSRSKSVRRACIEASKADVRERTQQLSLNATMEDSRPRDGADDDVADALRSGVGGGGGNDKVLHAESRGGGGAGGGSWHPFRPRRLPRSPGANRSAPPWIFPSRAFARCSVSPRSNATTISVSWSPMARTGPWPTNSSWIASASASRALHFRHAVRRFTAGRWLVLVGDSSMRMLYHHLVNTLLGRWTSWPVAGTNNHFEAGSCFDLPNFTWTYTQPDDCIEDYQLDGARITMVWSRFGDLASLAPLGRLMDATVGTPDVVMAGVAAWWAHTTRPWRPLAPPGKRGDDVASQYSRTIDAMLRHLESLCEYRRINVVSGSGKSGSDRTNVSGPSTYLREAWHAHQTLFVWLSPANCGNTAERSLLHLSHQLRTVLPQRTRWHHYHREAVPNCPQLKDDCVWGAAHPAGVTLNLDVLILMQALEALL